MALLELSGIAKHFGAIEALKGVDLSIESGEVVGLMGDNGAGKSTLVRVIAGNFRPSEGEIASAARSDFHKPVDARAGGSRSSTRTSLCAITSRPPPTSFSAAN